MQMFGWDNDVKLTSCLNEHRPQSNSVVLDPSSVSSYQISTNASHFIVLHFKKLSLSISGALVPSTGQM